MRTKPWIAMIAECLRCTEKVEVKDSKQDPLCGICKKMVGDRPSPDHITCEICGFKWVLEQDLICLDCFRDDLSTIGGVH